MEQNEEILIRVYQEKEHQYRDQIADLRAKLHASQQGEAALRHQLHVADEKQIEMQRNIDNLNEEKVNLQRKTHQIECELYSIHSRFEDFVDNAKGSTPKSTLPQTIVNGIYENSSLLTNNDANRKAPVPTPRKSKANFVETDVNTDLRSEVSKLRSEVFTLRNQLNCQIKLFSDEHRRLEEKKEV